MGGGQKGREEGKKDALEAFHCPSELFLEGRRKPEVGLAAIMTGSHEGSIRCTSPLVCVAVGSVFCKGDQQGHNRIGKSKQGKKKRVDKGKIPRGVGKERKEGSPD